jgi:hypothetical protein
MTDFVTDVAKITNVYVFNAVTCFNIAVTDFLLNSFTCVTSIHFLLLLRESARIVFVLRTLRNLFYNITFYVWYHFCYVSY